MTRPLFERPSALPTREMGLRARAGDAAGSMRRAALGVEYTKGCEIEKGLHSGDTGAQNPSVGFDSGPDAKVNEIIYQNEVSYIPSGEDRCSRTSEVGRVLVDDYVVQA